MNRKSTTLPPEYNLLAGALFVCVGASVTSDASFSHFTWGTMSGSNVRVGGLVMMAMGIFLIAGYSRRVMPRLKDNSVVAALFAFLLCGMVAVPFLEDHAGFYLAPVIKFSHLALLFIVGHILHKILKLKESPRSAGSPSATKNE